jgi:hypothetical protein
MAPCEATPTETYAEFRVDLPAFGVRRSLRSPAQRMAEQRSVPLIQPRERCGSRPVKTLRILNATASAIKRAFDPIKR